MYKYRIRKRINSLAAILLASLLLLGGCGGNAPAPAAESASEDTTEAAMAADTEDTVVEEEPRLTVETAMVGVCLARTSSGDNERLLNELRTSLEQKGFHPDHILVQDPTGSRTKQKEQVEECLGQGCSLVIVSPVSDEKIGEISDLINTAGASALFINCDPAEEEIERWKTQGIQAVWIGSTYAQQIACQMSILYECSGKERGLDFNEDGHVGTILIGGGEEARSTLEETLHDLGTELRVLEELDYEDDEQTSMGVQEILNEYRKEAELVLCSTEQAAQAAADGVQMRHRLVGRDILVIGAGAHEDTCTAIINKLMSGSTFTDFYEQANLAAVAAKDMIEGNQQERVISSVIFKVTEDNAQEVLDQLWKTRAEKEDRGEKKEEEQEKEKEEEKEEERDEEEEDR